MTVTDRYSPSDRVRTGHTWGPRIPAFGGFPGPQLGSAFGAVPVADGGPSQWSDRRHVLDHVVRRYVQNHSQQDDNNGANDEHDRDKRTKRGSGSWVSGGRSEATSYPAFGRFRMAGRRGLGPESQ